MVDMMTINAAVQSGNVLWKIITASKQLIENSELVAAVSEVNTKLMSAQAVALNAQQEQAALTETVRELEQKIMKLEDWNREKERYQLTEIVPNVLAYSLKAGMEQGEPSHRLCTKCYGDNKKSILQSEAPGVRFVTYFCPRCGMKLEVHKPRTSLSALDEKDDAQIEGDPRFKY